MISRLKEKYPVSPSLMQYLHHFGRRAEIPVVYDDLLRFTASMPYENPSGQETLWLTVAYEPSVMAELQPKLTRLYAMLKIGGENVDPMEVEAFLMAHAAVDLAVVVSYPDARLSEVGIAYVRLKPGQSATEDDIIAHCRGRIASYKIPRRVIFTGDFPMTSSGKIQKTKLREDVLRRYPPDSGT